MNITTNTNIEIKAEVSWGNCLKACNSYLDGAQYRRGINVGEKKIILCIKTIITAGDEKEIK